MLQVSPDELYLEGPFDRDRRTLFTLVNHLPKNQVFKIKSTAPDRLAISPKDGFVKALDRIEVRMSEDFKRLLQLLISLLL